MSLEATTYEIDLGLCSVVISLSFSLFLECIAGLKEHEPFDQYLFIERLRHDLSCHMGHVSAMRCHGDAKIAFTALRVLQRGKVRATRDHIVLRFKAECRDLDLVGVLGDGDVFVVVVPVGIAKHSREDVVIHGTKSTPVGR